MSTKFNWSPENLKRTGALIRNLASWDYQLEEWDLHTRDLFDKWLEAVKKQSFDEGYVEGGLDRDG